MALLACLAETGKSKTLKEFLLVNYNMLYIVISLIEYFLQEQKEIPQSLLEQRCKRWVEERNATALETLIKCKKYLSDANNCIIIQNLMKIYRKYILDFMQNIIVKNNQL